MQEVTLRGWIWHIYRQGSAEYFLGFEFRTPVFGWVLVTAAVFFGRLLINAVVFYIFNCILGSIFIRQVFQ